MFQRQTNTCRWPFFMITATVLAACAGCPDYSHLRPVPDYANQIDPDSGDSDAEFDAAQTVMNPDDEVDDRPPRQ